MKTQKKIVFSKKKYKKGAGFFSNISNRAINAYSSARTKSANASTPIRSHRLHISLNKPNNFISFIQ